MIAHLLEVGAPDPEKKTSPILDEDEIEESSLDLELESGACYYNGVAYPVGQWVRSGSEVLHCEERGLWVRRTEVPV